MAKYIFVTGGVVSSLGKGITASAIGALIQAADYRVNMMKIDPYINVDAGTMRPYEHGEVFVTSDGTETDLDLGNYERFLRIETSKDSAVTTGKVYQKVIEAERRGEYLGQTVQVIPHITDEIKRRIRMFDKHQSDVCIVELGGTVGDIESVPFIEAIRQFILEEGPENTMCIHLTLVPTVTGGELKTKPSQHSVKTLMSEGLLADMLICRSKEPLTQEIREKLSLFCNVPTGLVISLPDAENIYEIPLMLHQESVLECIEKRLSLPLKRANLDPWKKISSNIRQTKRQVNIAFVGKYFQMEDAYKSVFEAFQHAAAEQKFCIHFHTLNPEDLEDHKKEALTLVEACDGIFVPGGFGNRGISGKIKALQYGRTHNKPTFGICLGMQCAVIEYARNILGLDADSTEFDSETAHPVIEMLSNLKNIKDLGGTMRLGAYEAFVKPDTLLARIYGTPKIQERHRHRFEVNPAYVQQLESKGLTISAQGPSGLVEAVEIASHPWYIAVQYHPEFLSSPLKAHPLFLSFLKAAENFHSRRGLCTD